MFVAVNDTPPVIDTHLTDLVEPGVVEVTGRVKDLEPYYERARLVIAPLRSGGGTRLKILEAMAYGRPVVSTRLGAEGLDILEGREITIADEPGDFAKGVLDLLSNSYGWLEQVQAARQRVERDFDWKIIAARLVHLYNGICFR